MSSKYHEFCELDSQSMAFVKGPYGRGSKFHGFFHVSFTNASIFVKTSIITLLYHASCIIEKEKSSKLVPI